jgi:choline dehydrogenase
LQTDRTFLSYVNSAVAYVNATNLFGAGLGILQTQIQSQIDQYVPDTSTDQSVIAGYKAIYDVTANTILTSPIGQIELVMGLMTDGIIQIGANLQHPFSHGSITINSANPLDYPLVNPNYLSHPADVTILREGVKMARRLGNTAPLASSIGSEQTPGPGVQTDDEWETFIRSSVFTEYHPSSTCAMLPREQGGVVDANLRVYGLANVRVADASVPPISFAAHLMAPTYGLAEQASTIIRNYHNLAVVATGQNSTAFTTSGNSTQDGPERLNSTSVGGNASTADSRPNGAAAREPSSGVVSFLSSALLLCATSIMLL